MSFRPVPSFASALVAAGLTMSLTGGATVGAHEAAPEGAPVAGDAAGQTSTPTLSAAQRLVIRQATAKYWDVNAAIADGYLPTDECAELPGVGGMGYHYVNPALLGDGRIDPTLPEVLLYEDAPNGKRRLIGVEYMVVDADQDLSTDADRPTMLGHPLEGPMPGHEPGMPVHYDLHAWVYKYNPAGNLATWNPRVTCS